MRTLYRLEIGYSGFAIYSRIEAYSHTPFLSGKLEKTSAMNRAQRFVCSTVVLCAVACLFPPGKSFAGDNWLPISPEDLALKDNPASPGANAMILYRESDVNAKDSETHEYVRIRIFTQEGTKEGNVELAFVKEVADIRSRQGRREIPGVVPEQFHSRQCVGGKPGEV